MNSSRRSGYFAGTMVLLSLARLLPPAVAAEPLPLPEMGAPVSQKTGQFVLTLMPKAFQSNPELDMTVICELTSYGRKRPVATPQRPAYYVTQDNGQQHFGKIYAGVRGPDPKYLGQVLRRALRGNGYLPADATHPPSLVLVYTWGTYFEMDPEEQAMFPTIARRQVLERSGLAGGGIFARAYVHERDVNGGRSWRSDRNDFLSYQGEHGLYFVVVTAYDPTVLLGGRAPMVWRTKLTVNALSVALDESLPPLILTASPYFGRDMHESEIVTRPVRRGYVKLGPLDVVEENVPEGK